MAKLISPLCLGTRGSVVEILVGALAEGRDLGVTYPETRRFLMTIPEQWRSGSRPPAGGVGARCARVGMGTRPTPSEKMTE